MMSSSNNGVRSCFPFTATQWQELENQAQVYKCMVSGTPVPSELLFTIRRSLDSSTFFFNQASQPIGWSRFHVGFGRKVDPEPGRCRRTDGKKWRCSKEAYPDSKYCERHMHRGRNRSRKPVELLPSSSSSPSQAIPFNSKNLSSSSTNKNSFSSYNSSSSYYIGNGATNEAQLLYSNFSPVKPPPVLGLSSASMDCAANFFLGANSQPHASDSKDYENSSSVFESAGKLPPFIMGIKQSSSYSSDYQPKKVMHHFLDERPPKDAAEDKIMSSPHHTTHLSISAPNPMHDFFITRK